MPDLVAQIPENRHSAAIERLRRSVLEGPGHTDRELRRAVAAYAGELWWYGKTEVPIPDELKPYLDKVTLSAYKVVDEDVEALRAAGYSEDGILEVTLACALGCGIRSLEVGLTAARGGG
jgi:hypothetical protein